MQADLSIPPYLFQSLLPSEEEEWTLISPQSDPTASFLAQSSEWLAFDASSQNSMENGQNGYQIASAYKSSFVQQMIFNQIKEAVFGPKDLRSGKGCAGHPLNHLIAYYLNLAEFYLSKITFEKVAIPYSEKARLNGLLFAAYDRDGKTEPFDSQNVTALLFGGSFAPQEAYMVGIIEGYRQQGVQVLAFNYPGFGDNSDIEEPTTENFLGSGEAAFLFLINLGISPDKIVCHGYSLGGYVAVKLAAKYNANLLIDRTGWSTALIATTIIKNQLPESEVSAFLAGQIGSLTGFGVPLSLDELKAVQKKIFIVQETDKKITEIATLTLVKKLVEEGHLLESQVSLHWIQESHFSSPSNTWTVNKKLSHLLQETRIENEANNEARKAWKLFLNGIKG